MKMIYRVLFSLILVLPLRSSAQLPMDMETFADSLNTVIKTSRSDSIRARASFQLVNYWLFKDSSKARACLEQGRIWSRRYPFVYALSFYTEAALYFNSEEEKAVTAYMVCDSLLKQFHTKEAYYQRANLWNNMAILRQRADDDRGHIDILLHKAIPFAIQSRDNALVGTEYVAVAISFMNMQQHDKAETYLEKAITIMRQSHAQPSRLVAAYNRAAENYLLLKKYPQARDVLDSIKTILAPYPDHELYSGYYMAEGIYHHDLGQYAAAMDYFEKGVKASSGANRKYRIQEIRFYQIKTLLAVQQYQRARPLLEELTADEELMSMEDCVAELSDDWARFYAGTGDGMKAYEWQKRYSTLSDSLHEIRLQKDINELELRFRHAEQEKKIAVLALERKQALSEAGEQQQTNRILIIASIFLLITSVIFIFYYRNSRTLAQQKEINYRQQLKDAAQQQQLQLTNAMLEGEERERQRIARDLHDGLGGMLAGIKIRLTNQPGTPDPQKMDHIVRQLDQSVTELRRIARNMMPESLLQFGLETAIKDLCESLMSPRTVIDFQAFDISTELLPATQSHIYRIVQEALNNAVRHGAASHIVVQCSQNGAIFLLTIEDNGKGFDTVLAKQSPGIGLKSILNRVEYLKGKMDIHSQPGEGTTINLELYVGS